MDLYVDHSTVEDIGVVRLRQMVFVHNALDDGWSVHKNGNNYVFKKKHHNDKEIFLESYLNKFITSNNCLKPIYPSKSENAWISRN